MKVILMDLFAAWVSDPELYIAYSRAPGTYNTTRYNALHISYRPTIRIVDFLRNEGFVEHHMGIYFVLYGEGRLSRMRATQKLVNLLLREFKLSNEMVCRHQGEETIILRNEEKKNIEYKDTERTKRMREHLTWINARLRQTHLNLHISDDEWAVLFRRLRNASDKWPIDFSRNTLRRIFNLESFELGGRFFGGWWQDIPSEYRPYIHIDMKPTVELDFSGYAIRMLYDREGIPCSLEDPYQVDGFDREYAKKALNAILNATSPVSAEQAVANEARIKRFKGDAKALCAQLRALHEPIADHFSSGVGRALQFIDSEIAEHVMLSMLDRGHVVLPVHDSFIVKSNYADILQEDMREAYEYVMNADACPIESDPSELDSIFDAWNGGSEDRRRLRNRHSLYVEREQSWWR